MISAIGISVLLFFLAVALPVTKSGELEQVLWPLLVLEFFFVIRGWALISKVN